MPLQFGVHQAAVDECIVWKNYGLVQCVKYSVTRYGTEELLLGYLVAKVNFIAVYNAALFNFRETQMHRNA